jgi:hypothetical protein
LTVGALPRSARLWSTRLAAAHHYLCARLAFADTLKASPNENHHGSKRAGEEADVGSCIRCGEIRLAGASFCGQCGANLSAQNPLLDQSSPETWQEIPQPEPRWTEVPEPTPTAPPAASAKKKSSWVAWVVVGIVVFAGWQFLQASGEQGVGGDVPISQGSQYQPPDFSNGSVTLHFGWEFKGQTWTWDPVLTQEIYDYFRTKDRSGLIDRQANAYTYGAFVTDTTDDALMGQIAQQIRAAAEKEAYSELEILTFALAFVQSIPYAHDDVTTAFNEYPRFPVETLVDEGSDCEDTSILYASLVLMLGYSAVMLSPPQHMAVGVAGTDLPGTYVEYNGNRYYYAETTGEGYAIGQAPDEYQGTQMRVYEVGLPTPSATKMPPPTQVSQAPGATSAAQGGSVQQHYLAQSKVVAIPAGTVYHHGLTITGNVRVDYSFIVTDDSSEDIGILRDSELAAYQNSQTVTTFTYHKGVQSASDSVTLASERYDLVIYCRNEYFDCDLQYSLSYWT